MQSTSWADGLEFTGDDDRLIGYSGALPMRLLAERAGLRAGLSAAMRENAQPTYKGGTGFCPNLAACDNTGDMLAIDPRPGGATSNCAADNIALLDLAVSRLPGPYLRRVLVRLDGAGFSHDLLEHIAAGPADPGAAQALAPHSRGLALDPRPDHRLACGQDPARTNLTSTKPDRQGGKGPTGPWNPAHRRDDRTPNLPANRKP